MKRDFEHNGQNIGLWELSDMVVDHYKCNMWYLGIYEARC